MSKDISFHFKSEKNRHKKSFGLSLISTEMSSNNIELFLETSRDLFDEFYEV